MSISQKLYQTLRQDHIHKCRTGKELLAKQITTPVEFIKSIEYVNSISKGKITTNTNSNIKSISGGSTYFIDNSGNTHYGDRARENFLLIFLNISILKITASLLL